MSKTYVCTALVLFVVLVAGCQEPLKDDSRFRVDPEAEAFFISQGVGMADAQEIDLVEKMAADRRSYRESLECLAAYYQATGSETKQRWAMRELDNLMVVPQYRYLMPAEIVLSGSGARDSLIEADVLYDEAILIYKEAGGLVVITDESKLRIALGKFNLLIAGYPNSDKADDAAYYAGRIYEHFGDYEIAVVYYQRAFQWSETTPYPARFRAAYVLDQRLHMRAEALTLYQMACEKEARYKANTEFAQRRILRLTEPLEIETETQAVE